MQKKARYSILFPVSLVYSCITGFRNWLYDKGILQSERKKIPLVVIGNLTVGGTGKTPHTEFLIDALRDQFRLAVLSRGYKRSTKGFIKATKLHTARDLGDEPLQMALKYPSVPVAVCENRSKGIDRLLDLHPDLELILLDDAFQHRRIRPGFSILLTDFNRLHTRDSLLPGGNLRESVKGSQRADCIIVTKCNAEPDSDQKSEIVQEVKMRPNQEVYFSSYAYGALRPVFPDLHSPETIQNPPAEDALLLANKAILLVTGVVSPRQLIVEFTPRCKELHSLQFPDHHQFGKRDFERIESAFRAITHPHKLILTTEKDAARLIHHPMLSDSIKKYIFVVPVVVQIHDNREKELIQKITDYVRENSGNR